MFGQKKRSGSEYVVPQNSVSTIKQRNLQWSNAAAPCQHCENMAKNFLYLESLIRSNYNPKIPCKLCYSSLKYLQFVNKSIMQVFGSCDAIVNAAKAFFGPVKHTFPNDGIYQRAKKKFETAHKNTKRIKAGRQLPSMSGQLTQLAAAANSHQFSGSLPKRNALQPKLHGKRVHPCRASTHKLLSRLSGSVKAKLKSNSIIRLKQTLKSKKNKTRKRHTSKRNIISPLH